MDETHTNTRSPYVLKTTSECECCFIYVLSSVVAVFVVGIVVLSIIVCPVRRWLVDAVVSFVDDPCCWPFVLE